MSTDVVSGAAHAPAYTATKYTKPRYIKTRERTLTRRAVIWIGQTCNLRCFFCYFLDRIADAKHPEHNFMSLEKLKRMCNVLRYWYGNNSIDIQGGEPTIYPQILELVTHCRRIGLMPTLITNGLVLAKPGVLEQYVEAGVVDFKCSLHGMGDIHDQVVCKKGAYDKLLAAMHRMKELEIPFRINCTMTKPVVPILKDVATMAIDLGAINVSFIAFNPFGDQIPGGRPIDSVPNFGDLMETLTPALDMLEAAGIEANVRYVPLCVAEERHRKNFYNLQQFSYDTNDWDYGSWIWTMSTAQLEAKVPMAPPHPLTAWGVAIYKGRLPGLNELLSKGGRRIWTSYGMQWLRFWLELVKVGRKRVYQKEAARRAAEDCNYVYDEVCKTCTLRKICDGVHRDVLSEFGPSYLHPMTTGPVINDPIHFIREQDKFLEVY